MRYRRTEVVTRADARLLWKQGRRAFSFLSGRGVEGILVSFIAQSVLVCALEVSNRARQIRIKDTKIPLEAAAARKGKRPSRVCWCQSVLV